MSIEHKFLAKSWSNGFQTSNAILAITPYKPEVLILGTFNPNTPNSNFADFFYGRNYFWPAFKNIFQFNGLNLMGTRMPRRGTAVPDHLLNPTLAEIFSVCGQLRLTFADLIQEVLHNETPVYTFLPNDNVVFDEQEYNLIQDSKNRGANGLAQMDVLNQVRWNTANIIQYLCDNPQIRQIYFTRQPTGIWLEQWNRIISDPCMNSRYMTNIFTPSGQGLVGKPRMKALLHHWLHNTDPGFGMLDSQWLRSHNVCIDNF